MKKKVGFFGGKEGKSAREARDPRHSTSVGESLTFELYRVVRDCACRVVVDLLDTYF